MVLLQDRRAITREAGLRLERRWTTQPPPPAPADCAVPIVQGGCEDGTETDVSGGCVIWPIILIFMVEFQR